MTRVNLRLLPGERVVLALGVCLASAIGLVLSAQSPTVIKGVDPITRYTVDLGDMPRSLQAIESEVRVTATLLRQIVRELGGPRPLDVAVKFPIPPTDPCETPEKADAAISQTASTRIVQAKPGMRIAVCQIRVIANAAEITSEWEGTGTTCGTGTIAHSGSTTVGNGESFAANGGYQSGSGHATVLITRPGNDFCVAQSGTSRVTGKVSYVYTP